MGGPEGLVIASFVGRDETGQEITTFFYPKDDIIRRGLAMLGRGTDVDGARLGPLPELSEIKDTGVLRDGNDLVIKIYWPEETRTSEVEILKRAKEYGEEISLIGDHIPKMICHGDPDFLCGSTKTIRQFLRLPTNGSRRLRVIVFERLRPIKSLNERDMLTAYIQSFFCKSGGRTT